MSLFNNRQGSKPGTGEAAFASDARAKRLRALRDTMDDAKLPERPSRPAPDQAGSPGPFARSRHTDGTEASWTQAAERPISEVRWHPEPPAEAPAADGSAADLSEDLSTGAEPQAPEPTPGEVEETFDAAPVEPAETRSPEDEGPPPPPAPPEFATGVTDDLEGEQDFVPVLPEAPGGFDASAAPVIGRGRRGKANNKTRLLGFDHSDGRHDIFAAGGAAPAPASVTGDSAVRFPVGWIVIVEGPGAGHAFTLFSGVSQIGRGDDQHIRLDFGDTAVSREGHAAIAYDDEDHSLTLAQGGKANLVRLNNRPVLSNESLGDGDIIRIGGTRLRVVRLCDGAFNWAGLAEGDAE